MGDCRSFVIQTSHNHWYMPAPVYGYLSQHHHNTSINNQFCKDNFDFGEEAAFFHSLLPFALSTPPAIAIMQICHCSASPAWLFHTCSVAVGYLAITYLANDTLQLHHVANRWCCLQNSMILLFPLKRIGPSSKIDHQIRIPTCCASDHTMCFITFVQMCCYSYLLLFTSVVYLNVLAKYSYVIWYKNILGAKKVQPSKVGSYQD